MKLDFTGRVAIVTGAGGGLGRAHAQVLAFEAAHITMTQGLYLGTAADTPEQLAAAWAQVCDRTGDQVPGSGAAQGSNEVGKAFAARRGAELNNR